MTLNIVHVSDLALGGSWFEKLIVSLQLKNFSQILVTLNPSKVTFSRSNLESVKSYSPRYTNRIFRYLEVFVLIAKARKEFKSNFLFGQGHEESLICAIAAKLLGLEFGLVHHLQPLFFPELKSRKPIKGFIHYELYKYYIRRAALIQSLSSDVTDSLLKLGVDRSRIVCLAHGVNFEEFAEKIQESKPSHRNSSNFPILLMVGRLSWEKNHLLAIESFKELRSKYKSAKLLIAGVGPMDGQLRDLVYQYNLEENVEFLGYVSNIPALMIEADALLHLSLSESYGQVYVEASLIDLPVITYRVGVTHELIEMKIPDITILNTKDPIEIASKIASITRDNLFGRKKRPFNPKPFELHNEKYVFQSIGDYLEAHGQYLA